MANNPEWLVMLYLAADNNLSSEMIWALKDIEDQGLPPGFEMTILYDALSPYCPTYVYDLSGKTQNGPADATKIESIGFGLLPLTHATGRSPKPQVYQWVEDSSNQETLRRFIEWSVRERPAKHRMLILSGHGSGAVGDFLPDNRTENGQHGSLTIPALQQAFDGARETLCPLDRPGSKSKLIDVLGMDSCLMSMAEVAYQVRSSVEYLVGSEGFVQNAGWPYGFMLKQLHERVEKAKDIPELVTPELMTQYIVHDYIAYYREYLPANVSVDMASCELAKLDQSTVSDGSLSLRDAVWTLSTLLVKELNGSEATLVRDMVVLAHWRAQSYKFEQYIDLWDFCEQLRQLGRLSGDRLKGIGDAAGGVQEAIDASVGRKNGRARQDYEGIEFQHSHGLSVYFPWSSGAVVDADRDAYQQLAFGRDSGWGAFLVEYLEKTRREPRGHENHRSLGLPIFGLGSPYAIEKAKRIAHSAQSGPAGRNAPNSSRNAPNSNRNAPNSNRMLELLFLDALRASMKNPPQSVYIRPPADPPLPEHPAGAGSTVLVP